MNVVLIHGRYADPLRFGCELQVQVAIIIPVNRKKWVGSNGRTNMLKYMHDRTAMVAMRKLQYTKIHHRARRRAGGAATGRGSRSRARAASMAALDAAAVARAVFNVMGGHRGTTVATKRSACCMSPCACAAARAVRARVTATREMARSNAKN